MTELVLWPKTYGVCFDHLCINFLFHTCQPLCVYNLFALNFFFLRSQERPCCERLGNSAQEYPDSSPTTVLCSWACALRSPERDRPAQQPQTLPGSFQCPSTVDLSLEAVLMSQRCHASPCTRQGILSRHRRDQAYGRVPGIQS